MKINDILSFSKNINGDIFFDYNIKNLNWFNIGGNTKIFFRPENLNELIHFLKIYKNRGKIFILGAGSNILMTDKTYDGVIIKLGKRFNNISKLNENSIIAGGNVLDRKLSEYCEEHEISGLEFLSCIPGTIGGGIKMNSGCYNKEFKDILVSIQALDFTGNLITIPANKIHFHYRGTNLDKKLIFLSGTFKGIKSEKSKISNEIIRLKKIKSDTQPSKIKTSGSTFKNPINPNNLKVWEIIRKSVPPDIQFGDAMISDHHANFFVNKKNASFDDMNKLITFVKDQVKQKYNINLELEVEIIN